MIRAALGAALLLSAACAHSGWTRTELYFGTGRPNGAAAVSDAEWQRFVSEEITPRFPQGFTVVPASGHWRGDAGAEDEASRLLILLWQAAPDAAARIESLRRRYQERFLQQSVLRVDQPAEVSF